MLHLLLTYLLINSTGPVIFDGQAIAFVYLNGTDAAVRLPLLPGVHTVKYPGGEGTVRFFDVSCSAEGLFECNFTAYDDLELPVWMSCGNTLQRTLKLGRGETARLALEGSCTAAALKAGDYEAVVPYTQVFRNYIVLEGPANITVRKDGATVLRKYGEGYVGFPELNPGEYELEAGSLRGKLVVEKRDGTGGMLLAALVVLAASALLLWG